MLKVKPVWRKAFIIFLLSFVIQIVFISICLNKFDRYEEYGRYYKDQKSTTHAMIKSDALKFYYRSSIIINQIKSGTNWFVAGGTYDIQGLYMGIIAAYGILTGKYNMNPDKTVPLNQLGGFYVLQALFYSLCVMIFYERLTRIIDRKVATLSAVFIPLFPYRNVS